MGLMAYIEVAYSKQPAYYWILKPALVSYTVHTIGQLDPFVAFKATFGKIVFFKKKSH